MFAAVLVPAGKLADTVGRKRVFLAGVFILAGSALRAAPPSVGIPRISRDIEDIELA